MKIAINEAIIAKEKGEIPVGAVITYKNEIIAKNHNQIIEKNNPLFHTELIAINCAINKLNQKYLCDCDMYVTLEPCVMCAGAIILSRMRRIYIGLENPKTGAVGSVFNIVQNNNLNHKCEVYYGIKEDDCKKLLKDFFLELRNK